MKISTANPARSALGWIRRRPRTAAIVTLAATAGLAALATGGDDAEEGAYHTVQRGDFLVSVTEGGTLEAVDQVVVRNELEGSSRIIFIVPEGTFVEKDQLIVELDAGEAEDALNQQQINYEKSVADKVAAENSLIITRSTTESNIKTGELNVAFAQMDLEKFEQIEKQQEKRNAEIEIITAKESLQIAEEKLAWTERLAEEGFETKSNLDRDRLSVTNQTLGLEKAENIKKMLNEYDLKKLEETYKATYDEAMRELDRVKKQGESLLAQALADLKSAERTLTLNESKLAKMTKQFEKTKIYAPQDGLVVYAISNSRYSSESVVEEGANVRQRQELIKIPDTSKMKVEIKVHESHISQVKVDQPAFVVLDSLPDRRFRGKVTKVALLPDPSSRWGNSNLKTYSTEIEIMEELEDIKPGVSARAEIVFTHLKNVITVPIQSVTTVKGRQICYVKRLGGAEPVEVEIGLFNNKFIEVTKGLEEGDQVLLSPPYQADLNMDGSVIDEEDAPDDLPSTRPAAEPERRGGRPERGGEGGERRRGGDGDFQRGGGGGGAPGAGADGERRGRGSGGGGDVQRGGGGERGSGSGGGDGTERRRRGPGGGGGERPAPATGGSSGGAATGGSTSG